MSDEQIVPSTDDENPGTQDGVGERVERGLGSDGVRRIDGEFGHLEHVVTEATDDADAPTP